MAPIKEPQLSHVLELLISLGKMAEGFILAGAQAVKFAVPNARATRDFDFVLDVISLRQVDHAVLQTLGELGYKAVESARYFQFQKQIPDSAEIMRIEFMAPEEFKRKSDFRVDVQDGLHARACVGGSIVIAESDVHDLLGPLPSGKEARARIRVTRAHALIMMKLWAIRDRYENLRGAKEYEHDRDSARIHTADVISILSGQTDHEQLRQKFATQFGTDDALRDLTFAIVRDFFGDESKPGATLYAEFLTNHGEANDRERIENEAQRGQGLVASLLKGI